ncbi:FmdB family zinc ribbon protein [Actinomycetospora cinnamomea]|uniref:FmdB family zinc ribbon protein n=1 Tax=Actinomycetospora cinnamomea TaxID=663609 RepID=UPI000E30D8DF|nr:FmdB family zinc ribbon protein [Actinomycetospora cinnamomea]
MPTYPYACTACDHRFEQVQAFSDPSLTECPVCGGRLRKVFSSVGIVFKGSGFYRNDARAGNGSSSEKAPAESSAGSSDTKASPDAGATSGSGSTSDSGASSATSSTASSTSSSGSSAKSA